MQQQTILFVLLAFAAGGVAAWQLRGWHDARKANRKAQLLNELAEDVAELESFKEDGSAAMAKRVQDRADAEKLLALKERIAALQ